MQNKNAESVLGESGLAGQLKKMLAEGMLFGRDVGWGRGAGVVVLDD